MHHRLLITVLVLIGLPMLAGAQSPQLRLPSFVNLQQKATESVDITIGSFALGLMGAFMDDNDQDSAAVKEAVKGLKGVQIRSYQFDSDFVYPKADIDAVRSQLKAPGWSQLTHVRNQKTNEDVDIYIALEDRKVTGFAIIASEPREFTILNIVGAVDVAQFARMRKHLNLPDAGLQRFAQFLP
jgi:hypothetical protein